MKRRNLFSLTLAGALLLGAFASCGESAQNEPSAGGPESQAVRETEAAETAAYELSDYLPEEDMGGYEVRFYGKVMNGVYSEAEDGETVNDAVYRRNSVLNERYHFTIAYEEPANQTDPTKDIYSMVLSGEDAYQVLVDGGNRFVSYIQAGLLRDFYEMKYQNFNQPWWYRYLNESLSVKGKLFMTASAFCLTTKTQLYGININRKLAQNYDVDVEPLFQKAREGTWVLEDLAQLIVIGNEDINGDGTRDASDQWGLQTEAYSGYALALGCGCSIGAKDDDDIPYIAADTERAVNIWDTLCAKVFSDKNSVLITQDIKGVDDVWTTSSKMWSEGRVFMRMAAPSDAWREYDFDYILLPVPKYSAEQETFYHTGSSWNTPLLAVPVTVSDEDAEKVSFILEALSVSSYYDILPVFYDNYLKTKLLRDEESVEMLELIQSTPVFDIGAVFNWGEYLNQLYTITRSGTNTLATFNAKASKSTTKAINKLIETLDALENG